MDSRTTLQPPPTAPGRGVEARRPNARKRNARGQGALLRTDILQAATELLDQFGNEQAVTLRAVARRVGIATPSIYTHFADRQAIMLAVVQQAHAELGERMTAADAGPDPVARLHALCSAYLDFARSRPQRYRLMFGGLWNAFDAVEESAISLEEANDLGQDTMKVLVTTLQECIASGRSASTDAVLDAVALWVALHGLAHQRATAPLFGWPEGIADRLVESVARLLPTAPLP